jgi:hypothetical protein
MTLLKKGRIAPLGWFAAVGTALALAVLVGAAAASPAAATDPTAPPRALGPGMLPTLEPGAQGGRKTRPPANEPGYVVRGYLRDRNEKTTTIAIPGAAETSPYAIDDRGRIAGSYLDTGVAPDPDSSVPPGTQHGFVWDKGRVTRLDVPGALLTIALDVDDRGRVAGGYVDPTGTQHGFLYAKGRYTTIDAPRPLDPFAMGNIATAIDDRGEFVIPEPIIKLVPPKQAS